MAIWRTLLDPVGAGLAKATGLKHSQTVDPGSTITRSMFGKEFMNKIDPVGALLHPIAAKPQVAAMQPDMGSSNPYESGVYQSMLGRMRGM